MRNIESKYLIPFPKNFPNKQNKVTTKIIKINKKLTTVRFSCNKHNEFNPKHTLTQVTQTNIFDKLFRNFFAARPNACVPFAYAASTECSKPALAGKIVLSVQCGFKHYFSGCRTGQ